MKEKLRNMIGQIEGMRSPFMAIAVAEIPEKKPEERVVVKLCHNEHREIIENALFDLEQESPTYVRKLLAKAWREHLAEAECDPCGNPDGRIAKRENGYAEQMFAEIHADKAIRAEKFRKTHGKNDTPADRRRNKMARIQKLYGNVWESGKKYEYETGKGSGRKQKTGMKKSTDIDADILRNLKVAELEKSAYADMIPDAEHYVGSTNLSHAINRYGKMLAEIRKPLEDNGCFCATNYYADSWSCSAEKHEYPQKYYDLLFQMQDIQAYQEVLMKEKLGQFTGICGPEMNSLWYYAHEAINYLNTMKGEC